MKFKKKTTSGFTLIELLVVISVISVISSIVIASVKSSRKRAMAAKVVSDFQSIQNAWRLWQTDSEMAFLPENDYGKKNKEAPCHGEPILSDTDIIQNISEISAWNGPYLIAPPKDPWGREYAYDNDEDVWDPPVKKWGGVNIVTQWCPGEENKYLELAPLIDEIYDKSDGPNQGIFKWDAHNRGAYGVLLATDPNH